MHPKGCTKFVQREGVCFGYDATRFICSHNGYTNDKVAKGGVCIAYDAKVM